MKIEDGSTTEHFETFPADHTLDPPTLDDFEAWCRGTTRNGGGIHYNALEALQRFRMFWNRQLLNPKN